MRKVRNILEQKGNKAVSVNPETTVFGALEIMRDENIGGLLVMEGEKLVGIFTERDYSRKVILKGKSSKDTPVKDLMTPNPITVTRDTTIEDCMQLMTSKFIRHLPVVERDHVVGVISIGDVVRYIIEEQRHTIESLEHYITGRWSTLSFFDSRFNPRVTFTQSFQNDPGCVYCVNPSENCFQIIL